MSSSPQAEWRGRWVGGNGELRCGSLWVEGVQNKRPLECTALCGECRNGRVTTGPEKASEMCAMSPAPLPPFYLV